RTPLAPPRCRWRWCRSPRSRERMGGLQGVPRTLVDITNSDPISVATAKTAFLKAGREEEWNAGVRSYLAGTFDKALRRQTGPANEVFTTLFQDPRQRANLQAALTPPQYRGFEDLMKVFEMVRRAPPEGSTTITDQGGGDALVSPGVRLASRALKSMSLEVMPRLSEWVDGLSAGRNAEQLAKVITTPAAVEELKKLRLLSPGSQKAITVLDGILARVGAYKVAPTPPERMPPAAAGGVP
ncbi:MAG: hypothetical protein K2Q10_03925, partial [Rhodospirillales bacterium]|nr:hypothetical protein [Rhodospirillales bacterium]